MLAEQPVAYGPEAIGHAPCVEMRARRQVGIVDIATLSEQRRRRRVTLLVCSCQGPLGSGGHPSMLLPLGDGLLGPSFDFPALETSHSGFFDIGARSLARQCPATR